MEILDARPELPRADRVGSKKRKTKEQCADQCGSDSARHESGRPFTLKAQRERKRNPENRRENKPQTEVCAPVQLSRPYPFIAARDIDEDVLGGKQRSLLTNEAGKSSRCLAKFARTVRLGDQEF